MLKLIRDLLGNRSNSKSLSWKTEESIFNFILSNLGEEGKLKDSAIDLPDEKHKDDDGIKFAPGLFDSMLGMEDSEKSKSEVNDLIKLIKNIAKYGDEKSQANFHHIITSTNYVINIIDKFLEAAVNSSLPIEPHFYNFSKDLAFKTNHRNSVKFGIAMLGVCQKKNVVNELKLIGIHDEFTIFSVVAIIRLSNNMINDLWELAQKVDGWGKIQIVTRLVKMDLSNEIKDWLITDGYKNNIMHEELAYICAVNGGLHKKLQALTINESLFKASSEIINALIAGGPVEDISHYQYASITVENYIRHAKNHSKDISSFIILNHIKDFLVELQNDISDNSKNGWTQDIISNCLIDTIEIINSKDWSALAIVSLKSDDNTEYWDGKQAAKILDIDIWEIVWQKLIDKPSDSSLWYDVVNAAKPNQVDQIILLAEKTIPLKELGTGPKDSLGLGPKYLEYQSLDYIITFLENHPKKGKSIITTALNSPVTRNRNMAIKVLYKWGKENWSEDIYSNILKLKTIEPNKNTKENISRLLNGEVLI